MTRRTATLSAAVGSLLALGTLAVGSSALAAGDSPRIKCYGVAKAGQNDCATKAHGCASRAKTDNDPAEWKFVSKDECEQLGGSTTPGQPVEPS